MHLRRSKTDQAGAGATLGIAAAEDPDDRLDAVAGRVLAGIRRHPTVAPPRRRAALRPVAMSTQAGSTVTVVSGPT